MNRRAGRRGVLCVGSIIVDMGKVIDAYPPIDRLALVESVTLSTGGAALNMAVDLRHLGAEFPVAVMGVVGDDANGRYVRAECARLGIDDTALRTVPGEATSFTDVVVEREGGRRTFFHHVGANARSEADAPTSSRLRHASCTSARRASSIGRTVVVRMATRAGPPCRAAPDRSVSTPTWRWRASSPSATVRSSDHACPTSTASS
jgi:sugar/nucleoside kinase (ribokinase family)